MSLRWFAAALAALALAPAGARPQEPGPPPERMGAEGIAGDPMFDLVFSRRARLGVKVNLRARDTDSIGAYVDAVTPGGPAAKAGIRSGDIITRLDGKSLLDEPVGPRVKGQSLPGLRLIELAARLDPDDTVAVELRRGKERKTVSVVTGADDGLFVQGLKGPDEFALRLNRGGYPVPPSALALVRDPDFRVLLGGGLADVELAPLNPDLGQYFGTSDGILVISVPRDTPLGLKGGDVVLAVDGRKPSSPSHLLRILRSYDRGESFKLDIMRNRKRETVVGRLAESGNGSER
jgi:S1-C subfamily serine protease